MFYIIIYGGPYAQIIHSIRLDFFIYSNPSWSHGAKHVMSQLCYNHVTLGHIWLHFGSGYVEHEESEESHCSKGI